MTSISSTMDDDIPSFKLKSPRRELQGPRPAPLKVAKDSHKIRKPPVAPPPFQHHQPPSRAPVIIYTVSPKIIHANPNEFMKLVQRLTGLDSSSSSSMHTSSSTRTCLQEHQSGRATSPEGKRSLVGIIEDIELSSKVERVSHFPSIISPNPSSHPPINPTNIFSPSSDANLLDFFSNLSPAALLSNKNYVEGSPSNFISSSQMVSPNIIHQALDIINSFFV